MLEDHSGNWDFAGLCFFYDNQVVAPHNGDVSAIEQADLRPRVRVAAAAMRTEVGNVRGRNEDVAHVDADSVFVIVADGMGGHGGGDVAAALAVSVVRAALEAARDDFAALARGSAADACRFVQRLLERSVRAAHHAVLDRSKRELDKRGMGTTLDVVVIVGDVAFVAHVGDSRTYLVRNGAAQQMTLDHTVAQVLRRAGALTAEEAQRSPLSSVLCNTVGCAPDLQVEHAQLQLEPGDRLLICTDGLYGDFEEGELARAVSSADVDAALAGLIDEGCARGGTDNLTGIVVEVGAALAAPVDEIDDEPTTPIEVPNTPSSQGPISAVSEDALGVFVEQVLRESSRPHEAPIPPTTPSE